MKLFKSKEGEIYAFEDDGSQDAFIAPDLIPVDTVEADALCKPTVEELVSRYARLIEMQLDTFARTRGYSDMRSLVSYQGDKDPDFNKEGTYGKKVRSETWRAARNVIADVNAGTIKIPATEDELFALLPTLEWPA